MTDWAEEKSIKIVTKIHSELPTQMVRVLPPAVLEGWYLDVIQALRETREKALAEAATVIRSQDTQQELEQLLSQAHEQGRREGLEEAAKIADVEDEMARDNGNIHAAEMADTLALTIRALAAQKKGGPG